MRTKKGFNCCHIQIEHAADVSLNNRNRKRKWVSDEFHPYEIRTRNSLRSKKSDNANQKRRKSIAAVTEYYIQTRSSVRNKNVNEVTPENVDLKRRKSSLDSVGHEMRTRSSLRGAKIDICLDFPARKPRTKNFKVETLYGRNYFELSVCKFCHVSNDNAVKYGGPPVGAKKERQVLKNEELCLDGDVIDEKPQTKLTQYSVYDKLNHLCSFDGNLIEQNVALYFSGYVKPITDDNSDTIGGHPCKDMGPITEWWVAGYDGGEKAIIGISSEYGDYYLMEPRKEYAPFMNSVNEKIFITKSVIDLLQGNDYEDTLTYENLVIKLEEIELPSGSGVITENVLLKHADFIYDQILSYDNSADPDDKLLINSYCIKRLAEKTGININNRQRKNSKRRYTWRKKELTFSKAATTRLVENVFEKFFQAQMDKSLNDNTVFQRCVVRLISLENLGWKLEDNAVMTVADIENNLIVPKTESNKENFELKSFSIKLERLSETTLNKYLNKNSKPGRRPRKIKKNSSYAYSDDEDYIPEFSKSFYNDVSDSDTSESVDSGVESLTTRTNRRFERKDIVWLDEAIEINNKYYFMSARVDDIDVKVDDFVTTRFSNSVALIKYMYENERGGKAFHGHWFIASTETILQEIGNPQELFLSEECEDIFLHDIVSVVDVTMLPILSNWNIIGNVMLSEFTSESAQNSKKFFYQKRYNAKYARFEDLQEEEKNTGIIFCSNCERAKKEKKKEMPYTDEEIVFDVDEKLFSIKVVHWRDDEFRIGSCVFLTPGTIMKFPTREKEIPNDDEEYDEDTYPERYRKSVKTKKDDEQATEPFDIAYIAGIFSNFEKIRKISDIKLKVKKFYRPQNTHQDQKAVYQSNLNLLYWSEEECYVNFEHVQGKCYVSYKKNLFESIQTWTQKGPYRFYFSYTYNSKTKSFCEPSPFAAKIGKIDKTDKNKKERPTLYPSISRPLRSLDVFAGCGGLSEGLHQANVAECRWAIEKDPAAAHAFRRNYPSATVFTEDCNKLLQCIINNHEKRNGQRLPRKGDVELLCGGPPCQGYSGMNRFNNGQCSKFNNSLIVSYLSYCDYYRPRFFILENVRNFVTHQNGTVLKLTLDCLIKMGYQVTFGVLQSGHFGIPQSRRRVIILAAAPGEILPWFPEPTHTFRTQSSHLQATFNDKKFVTNARWTSAPYRMITVYDAISDLPPILNGDQKEEKPYGREPLTNFQVLMRSVFGQESNILRDHITKEMNALVEKRMSYIPKDGDWRDLPNIVVPLSDGTVTRKLKYTHHDVKNGKSSTGAFRGVCCCASKQKCKAEEYKQGDTIIPWCLPHTGNRHNQWQGLYGRLQWDDYFRTVVTNPEPMGKQGRVLHPEQNRVISVRECARSQGFADSFQFYGNILDKYRQIGNAVAPPLAKAIALEIKKSIHKTESKGN